jgi:hypothetical protein
MRSLHGFLPPFLLNFEDLVDFYKKKTIRERQKRKAPKDI